MHTKSQLRILFQPAGLEDDRGVRVSWLFRAHAPAAIAITAALLGLAACSGGGEPPKKPSELVMEVVEAIKAKDETKAMTGLNALIEADDTNAWAYFERAQILSRQGKDDMAKSDAARLMELDPENRDYKWVHDEINKPANQRFKGRNAIPPSALK